MTTTTIPADARRSEVDDLRRSMNDLLSTLALPAMWSGGDPTIIIRTLVEALRGMLDLEFVYVWLSALGDVPPIETVLAAPGLGAIVNAAKLGKQLRHRFGRHHRKWPATARQHLAGIKDLTLATTRLSISNEMGVLVAACQRPEFPTPHDTLLLNVFAYQAAVALQDAALLREQRTRVTALDRRDAERAQALMETNEALQREIAERKRIEETLRRNEALLAGEKHLLELIASGRSLRDVLGALCHVVEGAAPDCICDIHTIDWSGPRIADSVAPSLPESFTGPIVGAPLKADVVPCGIAATQNAQVIAEDFDTDARWCSAPVHTHVLQHGLRSVWSTPICSKRGDVLGTLCVYHRHPASPTPQHQDIISRAIRIASIAIERLQAEEELRRNETSLADGQRMSQTGSFSWRVDTTKIEFSQQLRRIFEFPDGAEVTFEMFFDRLFPDDAPMIERQVGEIRRGQGHPEYELRLQMPDGRIKYTRVFDHVVADDEGRFECIGVMQDVTSRRLAEETLDKVRTELAHVSRVTSLGALAASIAHEVNQPLSGIITNASTCLRMLSVEPPDVAGALETARRTIRDGNRASEVVARLRALFSRKETLAEPVCLNEAAREVVALCLHELQRRGVSVQVSFDDNLPLVSGDRIQLQQVILNLILNAADALDVVSDRPKQIVVETMLAEDGAAQLAVRDNGVGITAEDTNQVFNAFYSTKQNGMGIGLSVSRSILDRHQGRLWASANDGPGAIFAFALPCALKNAVAQTAGET